MPFTDTGKIASQNTILCMMKNGIPYAMLCGKYAKLWDYPAEQMPKNGWTNPTTGDIVPHPRTLLRRSYTRAQGRRT